MIATCREAAPDSVSKFTHLEFAKERNVTRKNAEFPYFSRRNDDINGFAENFFLRRYNFEQNFFSHTFTIFSC